MMENLQRAVITRSSWSMCLAPGWDVLTVTDFRPPTPLFLWKSPRNALNEGLPCRLRTLPGAGRSCYHLLPCSLWYLYYFRGSWRFKAGRHATDLSPQSDSLLPCVWSPSQKLVSYNSLLISTQLNEEADLMNKSFPNKAYWWFGVFKWSEKEWK